MMKLASIAQLLPGQVLPSLLPDFHWNVQEIPCPNENDKWGKRRQEIIKEKVWRRKGPVLRCNTEFSGLVYPARDSQTCAMSGKGAGSLCSSDLLCFVFLSTDTNWEQKK